MLNACLFHFSVMISPIISILSNDKLTGENYVKWKSNMNAILVCKDLKFFLMKECPPKLARNTGQVVRDTYQKWVAVNEKVCCYLLAGMSEILAAKHEPMALASQMMESLQGMFGQPSERQCHEAVVSEMAARMKDGTSVREHLLRMMTYINTAEIHGARIDERSQVTMIMENLPKSFLQFKSNYVMNKLSFTLTQLLNELTHYESMLVDLFSPVQRQMLSSLINLQR